MKLTITIICSTLLASLVYAQNILKTQPETVAKKVINQTQNMSQKTLLDLLNNKKLAGHTLLDVRSAEEFSDGHIKGAVNMSHHQILQNPALLDKYKNTHLIVYCRSGRRAGLVTDIMQQRHAKKIYHLEGDMIGWQTANLPVQSQ